MTGDGARDFRALQELLKGLTEPRLSMSSGGRPSLIMSAGAGDQGHCVCPDKGVWAVRAGARVTLVDADTVLALTERITAAVVEAAVTVAVKQLERIQA